MASHLDNFLEFLAVDGGWHGLEEISASLQLTQDGVYKIARFFANYNFVDFDEEKRRVRINAKVRKFFVLSTEDLVTDFGILVKDAMKTRR